MPIMPRKSSAPEPETFRHIEEIRAYMKQKNTNVYALARAAGVNQSALARFLNKERKAITPSAQKVLDFIHNRHNWHNFSGSYDDTLQPARVMQDLEGLELINAAVMKLWNGERDTAAVIASLIAALEPTYQIVMTVSSRRVKGG
jgi:uncharacterized protein YeaO (DUF488 family)